MGWEDDIALRDLGDDMLLECVCNKCGHEWIQTPIQLLLKVDHRDVRLSEVKQELACKRPHCTHVGVRLALILKHDTSGFVGGMP